METSPIMTQQPLRILIADDDKDDRYFISLAFKEAGLNHILNFVKNGEELMEHLHQYSNLLPDLILLDLNMPKKDGRMALKEIKSNPVYQNINVIIFSTCISMEDIEYTQRLGASRNITKPLDFFELVEVIKDVCENCPENALKNLKCLKVKTVIKPLNS